jgi:hypothetical protein
VLDEDSRAFIYIHVLSSKIERITLVEGAAYWLNDQGEKQEKIKAGETIHCDDLMYIEPGGEIIFDRGQVRGGNRGRTHSFVDPDSLRQSAPKDQITKLLEELEELKSEEIDPLASKPRLDTEYSRVYAKDYAFNNFEVMAARTISESTARALDIVCLFTAGESACVAMSHLTIPHLQTIIRTLQKPVKPHVVDENTLQALMQRTYGKAKP